MALSSELSVRITLFGDLISTCGMFRRGRGLTSCFLNRKIRNCSSGRFAYRFDSLTCCSIVVDLVAALKIAAKCFVSITDDCSGISYLGHLVPTQHMALLLALELTVLPEKTLR